MKKNINTKVFLIFLGALSLMGCADEFLEEPTPTEAVSEDVVFGTREGVEAFISGMQRRARQQFTATDAGGIYSTYFARTIKGNDLIHASSWWSFDYANDNREPTYRRTVFSWEFPFYMINQANTMIQGVEASGLAEGDKSELIAQGRALRAFYYFQLALDFQEGYSEANRDLAAPPIYTEPSQEGKPMSTLGEMYDLIVEDLNYAVSNLGEDRLGKSYVNNRVANGILARVYLVMGNWQGAEAAANIAYGGNVEAALSPATYKNGFDDLNDTEWIWGLPQTSDQSNYYYAAPSAFVDPINPAYNNIYINEFFSDTFSETDARNTFSETGQTDYRKVVSTKFVFAFDSDIVVMRTAEMILIEAEAKFRQGDEAGARALLFALQSNRDPEALNAMNTGSALEEEILLERRKEMYGEFGVEWFDAKRLNRGIVRTPNHRIVLTLEPNDKRFYLKIPQSEIDANDNIDASVNANR